MAHRKFVILSALLGSCMTLFSCQVTPKTTVREGVGIGESVLVNIPGERIEFESTSPITMKQFFRKTGQNDKVVGYLTIPQKIKGKAPVVIILHCGSGVKDWKELKYARSINDWGYASFVIDSWEFRKIEELSSKAGRLQYIPIADVYNALKLLNEDSRIDPNRIAILGWANAAKAILASQISMVNQVYGEGLHFAAAVSIQPVNASSWWISKRVEKTPTLILCGEKDYVAPSERCKEYEKYVIDASGNITVISYPMAGHNWELGCRLEMRNILADYRKCSLLFNVDTFSFELGDGRTFSGRSKAGIREIYRYMKDCRDDRGSLFGQNDNTASKALEDVREFLKKHL